jgi:hypothetical protein
MAIGFDVFHLVFMQRLHYVQELLADSLSPLHIVPNRRH